jgi:tetratricopeptide (TPR) repeat protein
MGDNICCQTDSMIHRFTLLQNQRSKIVLIYFSAILSLVSLSICVNAQENPPSPTDDAVALFNQGQDEHAKGGFSKAIEFYDKALKIIPEFPEAEFQKGNAYLSLGKKMEAEASFRHAIDLRSEWPLPIIALGTLLERRGEFVEAEKLLNRAILLDSSSFPAYSALAELKLQTKASPDALKPLLEKVRSFSSKANPSATVFTTEASLENALGDKPAAKKSIERALAIDPNSKAALYQKANIAVAENDLVLADAVVKSLEKVDAGSEAFLVLRARILLAGGKSEEARGILANISSPSSETKSLIENVALATEQSPDALVKLLEKNPSNAVALGRLCSIYRVSDPAKSLDFCKRALDVEPSNINHAIGYAAALVQAKKFDEAVSILQRLQALSPENSTIHANLGTALFELKRFQEAKSEYEWLTARQPVPPIAYYFLAICHDQLGEYLDASANYNLFIKNADGVQNKLEIEKVKLRLPELEKQIKKSGGKSKGSGQ